jgi:threonine dehydrogenase-like Zn-dependent dehydrogenase
MRSIFFQASIPRVATTLALKSIWSGAIYAPTAPVRLAQLPEPELPGPNGIRVRNRACGICASDLHLLFVDVDPRVAPAAIRGADVIYLGHEVVSEVTEVGDQVTTVSTGDRVAMMTRFLNPTCRSQEFDRHCQHCERGDYALCEQRARGEGVPGVGGGWGDGYTCHESEVWKVPDGLTDDQATLVEPLACSVRAVLRRRPEPGDRVLVLGCGTIGLGVVQALQAIAPDVEVFAAARYDHQVEAARRWGAIPVASDLFSVAEDVTGAQVQVGEFSNTTTLGGFDVIYDCVGNDATVSQSVRLARAGGTVVIVGVHLKRIKADLTPIWHQEVDVIGSMAHGMETWNGEAISTFDLTARFLLDGAMMADGMITHRFSLDEWKKAVRVATDKSTGCIKVVFDYDAH